MEELFLKVVNQGITASYLVMALILLRPLLKRVPRWITAALWALVALRLVLPWSIESILSLIPSREPFPETFAYAAAPQLQSGISGIDNAVGPVLTRSLIPAPGASANPTQIWSALLSWAWATGVGLMLLYAFVSWLLLKWRMADAVRLRGNIFQSDRAVSPFVLGFFRPRIYLPYQISAEDLEQVVAHEQAHICRRDHWWKPLGFVLLSVFWFHPLLWVAYILFCRDIEAACDEKVIAKLDHAQRQAYSMALLNCAVHHRIIAACPLAFGEVGVKERIRSVMHYKRPAFWVVLAGLLIGLAVALCFLTDPHVSSDEVPVTQESAVDETVDQEVADRETVIQEPRKLTLNDVIILSQKGYSLTVEDYDAFLHESFMEGGSGLMVRFFDINSLYRLSMADREGESFYIHLTYIPTGDYIDIRDGGVAEFIDKNEEHPDSPVSIRLSFRSGFNEISDPGELDRFWAFLKELKTELNEIEFSPELLEFGKDRWDHYMLTVEYENGQQEYICISADGKHIRPQWGVFYSVQDPEKLLDFLGQWTPEYIGSEYEWTDAIVFDLGRGWASIRVIQGWEYETVKGSEDHGIRCRPQEVDEGWIYYSFWPEGYSPEETDDRFYAEGNFGGYPTLRSYPSSVSRDGGGIDAENAVWSYFRIRFEEADFAMVNEGADAWFLDYDDQIYDIYYNMTFCPDDHLRAMAPNG